MLANGSGNGILFVNTAGLNGAVYADHSGDHNQHGQHNAESDAVDFDFLRFLLLGQLTLGQLFAAFCAKLFLLGCTHEIISSRCSLVRFGL